MQKRMLGLVVAVCMVFGFSQSAGAASFKAGETDLSLGGSVRLDSGWRFSDYGDAKLGTAEIDDKTDFFTEHPGNSRVFLKAVTGKMTGYVELGIHSGVSTRHAYAVYDLGAGNSLLVGHTWVPVSEDGPSQRLNYDDGLSYFGELSFVRGPQIRFEHSKDELTCKLAVMEARTEFEDDHYQAEDVIPAIAATLIYDDGKINITPSLYAQRYELKALDNDGQYSDDATVTTYIVSLDASLKLDPLTLSGEVWYGQNASAAADIVAGQLNASFGMPAFDGDATGQGLEDVNSYGGWVQLAMPINTGTFRVGAGYQSSEVEPSAEGYEDDMSTWAAFINYEYPIYQSFTITPEIMYANYGKNPDKNAYGDGKNDLGTDLFVGVHFQYDF